MSTNLTPEQLAQRLDGITATDIAAIVGVHPYRSPISVFAEKVGAAPPFVGNDRTKWGNLLEPVIRKDYEERHGFRVEVHGTHAHPLKPWIMASPDGLVYVRDVDVDPDRGLEIKCHTIYLRHLYGDGGTDEVPEYELCQCTWGMAATGLKRWDLIAFIDGQTADYVIDRDDELIGILVDKADKFRRDHIIPKIAPEPDGSGAFDDWLDGRYKANNKENALINVVGEEATMTLVRRLRELRNEIAEREGEETTVVQSLKERIGDNAGIEWPNGKPAPKKGKSAGVSPTDKITWRKAADGTYTNYKATYEAARFKAQLVAGGKADEIKRALIILDKFVGDTFANSRATMTADDLRALIATMADAIGFVAKLEPFTGTSTGSRRFCVPRSAGWKAKAGDKAE